MSYRLKKDEPLAPGIRRFAREQLEQAIGEIRALAHADEGAAVLATRKHIKRTRALLRLVRRELGRGIFKGENRRLSGVARSFAGSRDARVQLQVLEKLRQDAAQERGAFPETTAALLREIAQHAEAFGSRRDEAGSALQQVCDRLEGWPLDDLATGDLSRALKRTYRRGRKGLRNVLAEPGTENFHSWRKRVKDLYYQAQLLRDLHPGLRETAAGAKALSRQLGQLHDFAFFRERLEGSLEFPEAERALLLGLLCTRERELERAALDFGAQFYAEKPAGFDRRLLADAA